MLEITGEHIKKLEDDDLRSLIGLLCEAELRDQNIPTKGVTWGGDQNAKDGGIDVRVDISSPLHSDQFIPNSKTGIQVKKPDMPRSEIINEMCPNGELRDSIIELAEHNGGYIIVSSQGSTSDSALRDRKNAMRDAISDLDNPGDLETDFYDRERIASWVRSHPSIILWVRRKVGISITGWQSYNNWAKCPGGVEEKYISDEDVRLYREPRITSGGVTPLEGINTLRSLLSRPGEAVRLTGLSGVGKTRLVQALFDDRIGNEPLSKSRVFYTDVGDNPSPEPRSFAEQLTALQSRAVLVVDNCPPKMHRRLASVCTASESLVSLLTVEYDIEEDQPEETEVFRLEAASEDLVAKLIDNRYNHIGKVEARQIAEFSGGNARIAIALAETVEKGESIAELKNKVLFERLFDQRNNPDNTLLRSAEVCSLVYSFDFRTDGEKTELETLSRLAGKSLTEIHADVVELQRRGLVQQRNHWRAVLPHAIANRLARRALENLPVSFIRKEFEVEGSQRLLKSFAHRLSYLHESDRAVEIIEDWLSKGGIIGEVSNLNNDGIDVFKYIAPVKPVATLNAIKSASKSDNGENFTSRNNRHFMEFTRVLRLLAYDQELFREAVNLLIQFAISEDETETHNSIRDILKSLFTIYLSGTHATPQQRLDVIEDLIYSDSETQQILGITLLKEALKSSHFTSSYRFAFGARTRNYGFYPESRKEVKEWYVKFIEFIKDLILSDHQMASKAKKVLANKFSGLWSNIGLFDELEKLVLEIAEKKSWKEGWVAIKSILRFNKDEMKSDLVERLRTLETKLNPTDLEERIKLYAFSKQGSRLSDTVEVEEDEIESDRYSKVMEITRGLGRALAEDEELFNTFLSDIVSRKEANLYAFGQGLANGSTDPQKMWGDFRDTLKNLDKNDRKFRALRGFINALSESNPDLCEHLLDEAITDEVLGPVFPLLQTSKQLDTKGNDRLLKALELDLAPLHLYRNIRLGGKVDELSDLELSKLLKRISEEPEGIPIAIEVLQMKFHSIKNESIEPSDEIIELGQNLLSRVEFKSSKRRQNTDYGLSLIVNGCLSDSSDKKEALAFCKRLAKAIADLRIYGDSYPKVLEAIATTHPHIFLDCFLENKFKNMFPISFSSGSLGNNFNPFDKIDDNALVLWCDEKPKSRYPIIASSIKPFSKGENTEKLKWTPIAYMIIENAPNKIKVLDQLYNALKPMSWAGSRADLMETRIPLLVDLRENEDTEISEWAKEAITKFKDEIKSERELEEERERGRQNKTSFE